LNEHITLECYYKLKTPDAIHAATALSVGCSLFLTNDPQFKEIENLNTVVLSEEVVKQK